MDDGLIHAPAAAKSERSALRYTWFLALAFLVGAPSAYVAWAGLDVSYTAEGNLWIEIPSLEGSTDATSIGAAGSPQSSAWIELLRSYQVLEPVVVDESLHIQAAEEDAAAFSSFTLADQFVPGAYELRVGAAGEDFVLVTAQGTLVQQGLFETPIGQNVGFIWTPARGSFAPGATVEFSVSSVRDAALDLSNNLETVLDRGGSFLRLRLTGADARETTDVLNALMSRYVDLAAELKTSKLDQTVVILEGQLQTVELELEAVERDLAAYRVISNSPQTMDEGRLSRRVQTTENLYNEVGRQLETVRLDAASSIPDVRILDRASVSQGPSEDTWLPLIAAIFFGCFAAGVGGVLAWRHRTFHTSS